MAINKIINHWTLLALNIAVIFVAETTGSYFANTGLVHLLAIVFVVLALIRALAHAHVHDQFLEPIIHRGILAMLILAVSHIIEFASYMVFYLPLAAVSANVVNFYLASTLIVVTGVEAFVGRMDNFSQNLSRIIGIVAMLFPLLIGLTLFSPKSINLGPSNWLTFVYITAILTTEFFCLWRLQILKKRVPLMTNFINYFYVAFILIGLSALFYTLEEVLTSIGIPFIQIIYLNHFLFYGALSLIYLAYDRLLHLGGIYNDLEKEEVSFQTTFSILHKK